METCGKTCSRIEKDLVSLSVIGCKIIANGKMNGRLNHVYGNLIELSLLVKISQATNFAIFFSLKGIPREKGNFY